ncbi:TonB-dependent receptor [Amphiplicatus metriothermophilus]|uniref:Outer membrane receptor proteins, mostly Fe transport n=1 Tax=Amphiplicatus metriothermophilus TaxID=1519374 RepID=A0A239PW08_9PROT|nr:TonB-dependent receptor [Amphiplicatus metriothermophilus]MBB5518928.1 outer membrane receptor protein involved in Fe transport [Amphiplicatus metriothermophilus]SNT74489.1 Outer membrane receptor proteins, mostly Fe transport [Amphiplicatus metriothermophilus]
MAHHKKLCLLSGAALLALSAPAYAQEGAEGDAEENASKDVIVVTARFREESIQDIGASVTGLSEEALQEQGLRDLDDIARIVPGLQTIKSRQNSNDIAIRGVISAGSGYETSAVFSVYVDEVSVAGAGNLRDFSSVDLNRIEVIRGPQPTLYGEGAVGGVIRYFTKDPDLDGPRVTGTARGQIESINEGGLAYSGENGTSIILAPGKLGVRLSGFYRKDEGFIDNPNEADDVNGFDSVGGRAVILAQPTDALEIRLSAFLSRDDMGESTQVDPGSDPEDLTFSASPMSGDFSDDFDLYSGRISYDFGALNLTSITGYYERRTASSLFSAGNSFGLAPFFPTVDTTTFSTSAGEFQQWSEEVRLVSDFDGPLNFTSGFYFRDRQDVGGQFLTCEGCAPVTTPQSPNLATRLSETQTRQYSGFLELTYEVSDVFRVIGGARYVNDTVTATLLQDDVVNLVPRFDGMGNLIPWTESDPIPFVDILATLNGAGLGTEFEFVLDRFLPRGGVEYDVTDDAMLYLNAALGARNGGVGNAIGALGASGGDENVFFENLFFEEDSVFSVDGGVKSAWLDGALTANLGVFYTKYKDTQIQVNTPANNTINGPNQRLLGLELETAYRFNDMFATFLNASVLDAEFQDGQVISPPPPGVTPPYFDLAEGNSPSNVPEFTLATGYTFKRPTGWGDLSLTSSGSFQYVGKRYSSVQNFPSTQLDPLEILNLRIGVENDVWALNLFASNLLDDIEAVNIGGNPLQQFIDANGDLNAPVVGVSVNRPRTFGVNLTLRY